MTGPRSDARTDKPTTEENRPVATTMHRPTELLRCMLEEQRRTEPTWLGLFMICGEQPDAAAQNNAAVEALVDAARQGVADTAQAVHRMKQGTHDVCEACGKNISCRRQQNYAFTGGWGHAGMAPHRAAAEWSPSRSPSGATSLCYRAQPYTAAARTGVELREKAGATGTVGDAPHHLQVHLAHERRELPGKPVKRAVAEHDGAVMILPWLVAGVLQRRGQAAGRHADGLAGVVGGPVQHLLHSGAGADRLGHRCGEQPADQVVVPFRYRHRHLVLGPPVQLRRAAGARTAAPRRPAVLDREQSLFGEPVEVEGGHPPADPQGLRGRVAADRCPGTGDEVEHGSAGRIVEGGHGSDAVEQRARTHDPIVKHARLDFRSDAGLAF